MGLTILNEAGWEWELGFGHDGGSLLYHSFWFSGCVELEVRVIRLQIQRCTLSIRMPSLGKLLKGYVIKVRVYCSDLCSSSALLLHRTNIHNTSKYLHNN